MSDDPKAAGGDGGPPKPTPDRKPDPIEDVRKGLGLLFRAAKSAIETLPTGKVEDVVISGAREVGRALENVTKTIDKELFGRERDRGGGSSHEPSGGGSAEGDKPLDKAPEDNKGGEKKPPQEAAAPDSPPGGDGGPPKDQARGPRVE